jgi:microcystin-dependent protein
MVRCGCASDQCSCNIVEGQNVTVSGTGSRTNPYVISAATQVLTEEGEPLPTAERLTGELVMWSGLAAPTGWLLCNGAAINRAVYADLFAIMGTKFGAGDGSTTFNLPNMSQRFPMGAGGANTPGVTGGTNSVTITEANLPAHTHPIGHDHGTFDTASSGAHTHTYATHTSNEDGINNAVKRDGAGPGSNGYTAISATGAHTHPIDVPVYEGNSGSTGSGAPMSIAPAYVAINFIVKT